MTEILERIDQLRSENSALLLHISSILISADGLSVAAFTQIQAAQRDAKNSFNHITKAGEVIRFGKYL